ncbi:MAG: histidinol dehydrogenase [Candidatus Margulisiibacteriota bacterium]
MDKKATAAVVKMIKSFAGADEAARENIVFGWAKKFDGVKLTRQNIKVTQAEINRAEAVVRSNAPKFLPALKIAARNIQKYHEQQREKGFSLKMGKKSSRAEIGLRVLPIERVGVYVPGGLAAYPSSVLMNVIPALVAGVKEIALITPPIKNSSPPRVNPFVLAAVKMLQRQSRNCKIEVCQIGGPQGIAALAYGIPAIKKVDKIVGPGNYFVTLAKKEVFGVVGIDKLAGPSEVLVIADDSANPQYVAAELLAQAEHDPAARAILVTTSRALEKQAKDEGCSCVVQVKNLDEAVAASNAIGPEHLVIMTKNAEQLSRKITNAGAIFIGEYSPVALGDYFAGTNHVLPTGGTARFSSPLGVWDFVKRQSVINYSKGALKKAGAAIEILAASEGLEAHAKSVRMRD